MKPIAIYADSRGFGTCRSCGARLEWAISADTSKRMPFNPPIVLVPTLIADAAVVHIDMDKTHSHFATCPQATSWRRFR